MHWYTLEIHWHILYYVGKVPTNWTYVGIICNSLASFINIRKVPKFCYALDIC